MSVWKRAGFFGFVLSGLLVIHDAYVPVTVEALLEIARVLRTDSTLVSLVAQVDVRVASNSQSGYPRLLSVVPYLAGLDRRESQLKGDFCRIQATCLVV